MKYGQTTHLQEIDGDSLIPVLGYGPNPNAQRVASRRVRGSKVLYDVLYSRDKHGRRITPDCGDKADTAILLFGCAFTYGEGVNDEETFAWRLGKMLGEKFQVFNYGYGGYGSHQMLALIESGRLDELVPHYKRIYAFYLTIPKHEKRCVGLALWDHVGPLYILENGTIKHAGSLINSEYRLFAHSRVYNRIYDWVYENDKPTFLQWLITRPLGTHVAIIAKSMHELTARYNAHFLTAIYPDYTRIELMLRDSGVRTLSLTDAMPDYASAQEKYTISDGHPNAYAHMRIAEALFKYILQHP